MSSTSTSWFLSLFGTKEPTTEVKEPTKEVKEPTKEVKNDDYLFLTQHERDQTYQDSWNFPVSK
jgi:hypothetical protein